MLKKKKIHLFFRKPCFGLHFSLENFYFELIKNFQHKDIEFKVKVCPLESKGILNRILITIWAFFNQGDINHICGDVNFIAFFLNKKKTINTILDHASLVRLKGIKRFIYYFFWVKIPILRSAHIITISDKTKKEILKFSTVNRDKITVSGVCIDSIYKKKIKPFFQKQPKILVIGTSNNKNIKNILMSLIDIDCELIIIGYLNKEYLFTLKKLKIRYKNYVALNNKSIFRKYVESDLLMFPSQYEGFGMPILEAQTVGRVVITSNLEPMKSVGGNGALYVNPYSVKNINNAIKKVVDNKSLRNKLIQNGFKNIKRFNKRKILKKHLDCYYNILKDNF